ncbi:hypothetical protein LIER_03932 [Lithospermum erythrorhizon]|uniref:Uncharacterized protein n=1 Tax=Lithospermum erythrorhizon TaxID=34254 RepID=A0AAV3NUV7_LITER
MGITKRARTHSDVPRPNPEMIPAREGVAAKKGEALALVGHRQNPLHQLAPSVGIHNFPLQLSDHASKSQPSHDRRRRVDRGKAKAHDDEVFPDHQSSNSNHDPHKTGGKSKHTRRCRDRSLSEDSHATERSYRPGYDLTTSDSSPERSPVRENRPVHKGKVTGNSFSYHRSQRPRSHQGEKRRDKAHMPSDHLTKCDARGSSNADLQKQVGESTLQRHHTWLRAGEAYHFVTILRQA